MHELTEEQAALVRTMLEVLNSFPVCADELFDCSYEELDALKEAVSEK